MSGDLGYDYDDDHAVAIGEAPQPWRWGEPPDLTSPAPPPREATMLTRDDGTGLIYPGRLHQFYGEMESGKSWLGLALTVETAERGQSAVYIDYEDDESSFRQRLDVLGCTYSARKCICYLSVTTRWDDAPDEVLDEYADPGSVVLDGVSEGMSLMGLNPIETDAAVAWTSWARRWTRTGSAVATIDHVVKDKLGRGRMALGSQHKGAGVAAAYMVEPDGLMAPGRGATINLSLAKDRHGYVRRNGGEKQPDRMQDVGALLIGRAASDLETGWYITGPKQRLPGVPRDHDPKMALARERVIAHLMTNPPQEMTGRNQMVELLAVTGVLAQNTIKAAITQLHSEGVLDYVPGPNHAKFYRLATGGS